MHAVDAVNGNIEAYLDRHQRKELLRLLTCGSVDDGKSTLIGRLLHDTKTIYEDQLDAVKRELKEEVGLESCERCDLFGLYTRRHFWTTNVIAFFHVKGALFDFKPNAEIAEARFFPLDAPPPGIGEGALRRFAELRGEAPKSSYW